MYFLTAEFMFMPVIGMSCHGPAVGSDTSMQQNRTDTVYFAWYNQHLQMTNDPVTCSNIALVSRTVEEGVSQKDCDGSCKQGCTAHRLIARSGATMALRGMIDYADTI